MVGRCFPGLVTLRFWLLILAALGKGRRVNVGVSEKHGVRFVTTPSSKTGGSSIYWYCIDTPVMASGRTPHPDVERNSLTISIAPPAIGTGISFGAAISFN